MVWFKVDDTLAFHAKVLAAGNAAMGLWVRAGSWSAHTLTDGKIPTHMARTLGTVTQARALVKSGLWIETDEGYAFHEWGSEERQPTRAAVETKREAWREKKREQRANSSRGAGGKFVSKGDTPESPPGSPGGSPPYPVPSRPVPTTSRSVRSPDVERRDDEPPELEVSIPRHRMPASWAPTTTHKAKCLERGIDLAHELEQFRSHAKARAVVAVDWDAEFDRWLGNARPRSTGNRPTAATGTSRALAALAIADQLDAQERSTRGAITDGPTTG